SSFLRERTTTTINSATTEEQRGIVQNTSSLTWENVEVTGLATDQNGQVVGIGKTFIGALTPGEQREYTISWPLPAAATAHVTVVPSTNMYLAENIRKIIGDPSLLR